MLSVASLAIVDSRAAAIASRHAINCAIIVQWHPWQQLRRLRGYVAPIIRAWSSSRCEVPDVPQTTHHPCTLQLRCGRHRLVPDYTFACTADMACTGFTFYAPQTALVQEVFSPSLTGWHKICDVPFNARNIEHGVSSFMTTQHWLQHQQLTPSSTSASIKSLSPAYPCANDSMSIHLHLRLHICGTSTNQGVQRFSASGDNTRGCRDPLGGAAVVTS
jgi:hypothetical protein